MDSGIFVEVTGDWLNTDRKTRYVMYSLIKVRVETAGRLGIRAQEPISCQRNRVVKALCREYPDDRENLVFLSWREELERIEDLHYSGTS